MSFDCPVFAIRLNSSFCSRNISRRYTINALLRFQVRMGMVHDELRFTLNHSRRVSASATNSCLIVFSTLLSNVTVNRITINDNPELVREMASRHLPESRTRPGELNIDVVGP